MLKNSTRKPWYIITNYPHHPSPYFSELDRANEGGAIRFQFSPTLPSIHSKAGIINLHRLKRLYIQENQKASFVSVFQLFSRLALLKIRGFKVVWTLHNLYPIDTPKISLWDRFITGLVLLLSDTVICHTHSDAKYIRSKKVVRCPVIVSGSGGITKKCSMDLPRGLRELIQQMNDCENAYLMFGNIVPYKEVLRIASLFLEATSRSTLFIVGRSKNQMITDSLLDLSLKKGKSRIRFWNERVHPSFAHLLFCGCLVAICHYKSSGRYSYFKKFLYPSSVVTAISMGTPIVAPRLPSVVEIAMDHPAMFYEDSDESIYATLQKSESTFGNKKEYRSDSCSREREKWKKVCNTYYKVYETLCGSPSRHFLIA